MFGWPCGERWVVLSLSIAACGNRDLHVAGPQRPSNGADGFTAPIASPCALTPVARQLDIDSAFPAVYVELAAVAVPKNASFPIVGQRLTGFLNTSDVQVLRTGNVVTKIGAPVTTAWDDSPAQAERNGSGCIKPARFDLTLTLHSVDLQKHQLKLEIAIAPAPPLGTPKDAWYVPDHRQLHTTAIVGDQQPFMLGGEVMSHQETPSILVATPYILMVPEHLNELLQCRLEAARKSRAERNATSVP